MYVCVCVCVCVCVYIYIYIYIYIKLNNFDQKQQCKSTVLQYKISRWMNE